MFNFQITGVCESYLEAYKEDYISLNGKKGLLESLRSICDKHYRALFGRIVIEAMGHPSQKKRGPSSNRKWLRAQLRFYMSFLKAQKSGPPMLSFPESTFRDGVKVFYPGNSYDDRIALIRARFHMMGLKSLVPSDDAIRELIRADKKLK